MNGQKLTVSVGRREQAFVGGLGCAPVRLLQVVAQARVGPVPLRLAARELQKVRAVLFDRRPRRVYQGQPARDRVRRQ